MIRPLNIETTPTFQIEGDSERRFWGEGIARAMVPVTPTSACFYCCYYTCHVEALFYWK